VLDEPTNDLDAETLELLEDLLVSFGGTLLLVSHDRALLDNVVTSTLVFEGEGRVRDYVGGYEDWLRQRAPPADQSPAARGATEPAVAGRVAARPAAPRPVKLGYKETRELADLPARIEALEQEQEALHASLADPALYQGDGAAVVAVRERLATLEAELRGAYERWESLEARDGGSSA
jgi:ATP-binding cassette subfamily F protein uup